MRAWLLTIYLIVGLLAGTAVQAELLVTTSSDPESNQLGSFIFVPGNKTIMQGIKRETEETVLPEQIPITAELSDPINPDEEVQWEVRIMDKAIGRIKLESQFPGSWIRITPGRLWRSEKLGASTKQRHQLVFYPFPQPHQPPLYKKGRSKFDTRREYGGGTTEYNDYLYNPRLAYIINVRVTKKDLLIHSYSQQVQQDDRDLLRQEYINHYDRARYGSGDNGNIPVPKRSELAASIDEQSIMAGSGFSQSIYNVMIEDGVVQLAERIMLAYEQKKQQFMQDKSKFVDLKGNPLPISEHKPWLSSGWRNPERNEWYSNAINGIHQRGAAIDIIPNERPGSIEGIATYWLLWLTLNDPSFKLDGYWQLETHGRPLKRSEFEQDIKPENGIPDAFDIADHLHIQLEEINE